MAKFHIDTELDADMKFQEETQRIQSLRREAYMNETDGLFYDVQRGLVKQKDWEEAVQKIKDRYPKPVKIKAENEILKGVRK